MDLDRLVAFSDSVHRSRRRECENRQNRLLHIGIHLAVLVLALFQKGEGASISGSISSNAILASSLPAPNFAIGAFADFEDRYQIEVLAN